MADKGVIFDRQSARRIADVTKRVEAMPIDATDKGTPANFASPRYFCFFPVKVEKTGGSDGSTTTAASWTYTVRSMAWTGTAGGVTLAEGAEQIRPRPNGSMKFQTGSTGVGVAYREDGEVKLWDAGEVENTCVDEDAP
jgi:hypothetical protein